MPELTVQLAEEQLRDVECAAGIVGETVDIFLLRAVLDEAHSLVQDPWLICQRLNDQFGGLLRRLG